MSPIRSGGRGQRRRPGGRTHFTFAAEHDEMVMARYPVRDTPRSCDHHLVPFLGRAHIARSRSCSTYGCRFAPVKPVKERNAAQPASRVCVPDSLVNHFSRGSQMITANTTRQFQQPAAVYPSWSGAVDRGYLRNREISRSSSRARYAPSCASWASRTGTRPSRKRRSTSVTSAAEPVPRSLCSSHQSPIS